MSIQEFNLPIYFNSSAETGAIPVGNLGNEFSVQLITPIMIPRAAITATLEVSNCTIWNSSPNISSLIKNNKMYFTYLNVDYESTFPDGLYADYDMNSFMNIFFNKNNLPTNLFVITSSTATQKVTIVFNFMDLKIDFTKPDVCIDVLGFNPEIILGPVTPLISVGDDDLTPFYKIAPNVAKFNRVENYYIVSNLLSTGIPQNQISSGILARIPIDVRNGSLINYNPTNPTRCNATELIGTIRQVLKFRLLDQLLRDVSTFGEDFSFCINIRYYIIKSLSIMLCHNNNENSCFSTRSEFRTVAQPQQPEQTKKLPNKYLPGEMLLIKLGKQERKKKENIDVDRITKSLSRVLGNF